MSDAEANFGSDGSQFGSPVFPTGAGPSDPIRCSTIGCPGSISRGAETCAACGAPQLPSPAGDVAARNIVAPVDGDGGGNRRDTATGLGAGTREPEGDRYDNAPWWDRLVAADPVRRDRGKPCCRSARFDVFCAQHENFLPLGGKPVSIVRLATIGALVFAVVVAVVGSARWNTAAPLVACGYVLGLALLTYPLRAYPVAKRFASICWTGAVILVVSASYADTTWRLRVVLGVAAVVLSAWFLAKMAASHRWRNQREKRSTLVVTTLLVLAPLPAAVVWPIGLGHFSTAAGREIPAWWIFIACGALVGCAVMIELMSSFTRSSVVRRIKVPFSRPSRPAARRAIRRPSRDVRRARGMERVGVLVIRMFVLAGHAASIACVRALHLAQLSWYHARVGVIHSVNAVYRLVARMYWRLVATLASTVVQLGIAGRCAIRAYASFARFLGIPSAMLLLGAVLAAVSATLTSEYLHEAPLVTLIQLLVALSGVITVLAIAWMLLIGAPVNEAIASQLRTLYVAGATVLVVFVPVAWVVGVAAPALDVAPLHVGEVTVAATIMLIVGALSTILRRRGPHERQAQAAGT